MRTLLFALTVLFFIPFAQANKLGDNENQKNSENSKTKFYKSLVMQNDLKILISTTAIENITTKKEFFSLLIEENGLRSKHAIKKTNNK